MTNSLQYVQANGLNIYYEMYGAGPPLILVHGGLGTSQDWQGQVETFAEQFQVFVPDSRGHGRTDNPVGRLSYRVMADDLAAFVQSLDLQQPLIYGYSDGGQIALELAIRYPQLARGVVIGAAWFKFSDSYRAMIRPLLGDEADPAVDMNALESIFGDYMPHLRAAHAPVYGETYLDELLVHTKAMWLTPLNYTAADFAHIAIPTLILVGDRDDAVPVEEAVEMYRLIPTAELCIVPHTNHMQAGSSAIVKHSVLDFLARHNPQAEQSKS